MKCNNFPKKRKKNDNEVSLFFVVISIMIVFVSGVYVNNSEILPEVYYEIRINDINSILIGKTNKNCSMTQNLKININFCHIKGSRESRHE